jgi:hypothetical protein
LLRKLSAARRRSGALFEGTSEQVHDHRRTAFATHVRMLILIDAWTSWLL